MEIHHKIPVPENYKLKIMIGEKIRNFDYETLTPCMGKIESGAVMKSRKGLSGVEGGKGICYPWKDKGPVFARRPLQFAPRDPRSCAKTRTRCRQTF